MQYPDKDSITGINLASSSLYHNLKLKGVPCKVGKCTQHMYLSTCGKIQACLNTNCSESVWCGECGPH